MYNIAILRILGRRKTIELSEVNLYKIIRNELGYSYVNIDNGKKFLKEIKNDLSFVEVSDMIIDLISYIKTNFRLICKDEKISFEMFYEKIMEKQPIKKNSNIAREILKRDFELLDEQIHILKMKSNLSYRNTFDNNEFMLFLNNEKYIKAIDKTGVYCKGCYLYYKKVNHDTYLVFVDTQERKRTQRHFDLYKIINNKNVPFEKMNEFNSTLSLVQGGLELKNNKNLYNESLREL